MAKFDHICDPDARSSKKAARREWRRAMGILDRGKAAVIRRDGPDVVMEEAQ